MARKLSYRPVEPIELEFADGVTKCVIFNSISVAILEEEFGGLIKVLMSAKDSFFDSGTKIIYAGMKAYGEDITFEEAKSLVVQLPFHVIVELFSEFGNNSVKMNSDGTGKNQEVIINFLKEMLQSK